MKFTPARNTEFISLLKLLDTKGHIVNELFLEAIIDITRGDIFTFAARKWAIIDLEGHRDCRLVDGERRQGFDLSRLAERVRNAKLIYARKAANIARRDFVHFDALKTHETKEQKHFGFAFCAVRLHDRYL